MSTLVSAKNLLVNYDIRSATDETGTKYRGTAHEFQDYAFKLASDLNDLENLKIYMRLAKIYPRYLMDEAYQFVSDVKEERKGKLYMWKFKQVKDKYKLKKDLKNFDYEFVLKKMKKVRDSLASKIVQKNNDYSDNEIVKYIESIFESLSISDKKQRILIVGNECPIVPSIFAKFTSQIYGLEISSKISKDLKEIYGNPIARKFINKDIFSNSYNSDFFDLIVVNKFWNYLPMEKEHDFVKEISKLLKIGGKLIVSNKSSNSTEQRWKKYHVGNEERYFFEKKSENQEVQNIYSNYGFKLQNNYINMGTSINYFVK